MTTKAICFRCGESVDKRYALQHIGQCFARGDNPCYLLKAECVDNEDYWLYFDLPLDDTLYEVDEFLRKIWLECCGHMSAFSAIDDKAIFEVNVSDDAENGDSAEVLDLDEDDWDDIRKDTKLSSIVEGARLRYEYDFGTTTKLIVTFVQKRSRLEDDGEVHLRLRNIAPEIPCGACHKKPATNALECRTPMFMCDACAENNDDGEPLPITNSPRCGVCSYDGKMDFFVPSVAKQRIKERTKKARAAKEKEAEAECSGQKSFNFWGLEDAKTENDRDTNDREEVDHDDANREEMGSTTEDASIQEPIVEFDGTNGPKVLSLFDWGAAIDDDAGAYADDNDTGAYADTNDAGAYADDNDASAYADDDEEEEDVDDDDRTRLELMKLLLRAVVGGSSMTKLQESSKAVTQSGFLRKTAGNMVTLAVANLLGMYGVLRVSQAKPLMQKYFPYSDFDILDWNAVEKDLLDQCGNEENGILLHPSLAVRRNNLHATPEEEAETKEEIAKVLEVCLDAELHTVDSSELLVFSFETPWLPEVKQKALAFVQKYLIPECQDDDNKFDPSGAAMLLWYRIQMLYVHDIHPLAFLANYLDRADFAQMRAEFEAIVNHTRFWALHGRMPCEVG